MNFLDGLTIGLCVGYVIMNWPCRKKSNHG